MSSFEELMALSPRLDVVVIATPDSSHARLAAAALERGTAVVVDKPLAQTSQEARALIATAKQHDALLTVFQNMRWDSDFLTVQRLLEHGVLGVVSRFESRLRWWAPTPEHNWREEPRPGTVDGHLADLGTHVVDQALILFGPVQRVYAEVDTRRPGSLVNDDVFVALTHSSGVRSHLYMGSFAADGGPRFVVYGTKGAFVKRGRDVQQAGLRSGQDPTAAAWGEEPSAQWGELLGSVHETVQSLPGRWPDFYAQLEGALRHRRPPPVDPRDALEVLRILEAAATSASTGTVVGIAPQATGPP
jgi:predicted dehydrogenase